MFQGLWKSNIMRCSDGVLDGVKFWVPTYGHCTAELLSTVLITTITKYDQKTILDAWKLCHQSNRLCIFPREWTSESAKQLSAMRKGIWNGQNANVIAYCIEGWLWSVVISAKLQINSKEWAWNGKMETNHSRRAYNYLYTTRTYEYSKDTKPYQSAETLGGKRYLLYFPYVTFL